MHCTSALGLHIQSIGLLQRTAVWRVWRADASSTIGPERRRVRGVAITSRQLHWLPVRQRVTFKIAVLYFQRLAGQAPAYLADDCQLTSDVSKRRLRSTDTAMCVVRRSNNSFVDRCFAAAGPRQWNTLPVHLLQCDSLRQFKRCLGRRRFVTP